MLSPDNRSLYTAGLTPPAGYVLDQALATTFSLEPTTLLTVPLHLALLNRERDAKMDGIALLEALRRIAERTSVYVQQGRVHVPTTSHVLYALLEPMIIEARAPHGGAFHPKLWVLRFVDPSQPDNPLLRLLVLSRNLTTDRSWDLLLQVEGRPGGQYVAANRELGELIRDLPDMAAGTVSDARRAQAADLGEAIRRTRWDLPDGFESLTFHVLGRKRGPFTPPRSHEMAVISPFVTADALAVLRKTTESLRAVISRSEELDALPPEARALAKQWATLNDAAETEGDDVAEARDTIGLHAKVLILRCGWETKLFMGSANATSAALLAGINIEVMAELVGKRSRVKGIDDLLGPEGLGPVLVAYTPPEAPIEQDEDEVAAETALENGRSALANAGLSLRCERDEEGWTLVLEAERAIALQGIASLRVWPLTVAEDRAADAWAITTARRAGLGRFATASVTALLAFELAAAAKPKRLRFALNLPVGGLPDERDAAILRTVVQNRGGFLRYLLLLLGQEGAGEDLLARALKGTGAATGPGAWGSVVGSELPLLEELTRAFSRDPERLRHIGRTIAHLLKSPDGEEIVPRELVELWRVFEVALSTERPGRSRGRSAQTEGL